MTTESKEPGRDSGITSVPYGSVVHRMNLGLTKEAYEKILQHRDEYHQRSGKLLSKTAIINSILLDRLVIAERPRMIARWGGLKD
ncbi:MAG: hypothetical protein KZQ91_19835 [Candidatus Thiodiazotropha sp. (ex Lucinoma borealis)]|nr:hypothetical protein [Candidatus Thiodiazotropha sp. (ex Lucinoma borealis)]